MKESNLEIIKNTDQSTHKNEKEENIEEIKKKLESLAKNVSKYSPDSKKFFKIKEAFIKIQPIVEKKIKEYIEQEEKAESFGFVMDWQYEFYFELIDKLNLITESNKEIAARLFMVSSQIDHTIAHDILRKRNLYESKEKNR